MGKTNVYRVHFNAVRPIFPLALGNVVATVKKHYPELSERLNFQTPWLTNRVRAMDRQSIDAFTAPSIFLMSDYLWNTNAHTLYSRMLKQSNPNHLIIHGGPSVHNHSTSFLENYPAVDFAVHGEGEATLTELLYHILFDRDYNKVKGISFRNGNRVVKTEPRERIRNLEAFPSTYLSGEFNSMLLENERPVAAIVETNRGCPYRCVFCDWGGSTLQKIRKRNLDTVLEEIEWIAANKMHYLWIADANFGIFDRDLTITEHICKMKERYGHPVDFVANFAKSAKFRTVEIVRMLISAKILASIVISVQTLDQATLRAAKRKNMKSEHYEALRAEFTKKKLPAYVQLMLGLPGSNYELFKKDLDKFLKDKLNFMILTTVILPNCPMAEQAYREQYGIETEILRNETGDEHEVIVATNSFSREEFKKVHMLSRFVAMAICNRALKYITYTVSVEKQVVQTDVFEFLIETGQNEMLKSSVETDYPILRDIIKTLAGGVDDFFERKIYQAECQDCGTVGKLERLNQWDRFFDEIRRLLISHYAMDERILDTAIKVQKQILPSMHHSLSSTQLDYDFIAYYLKDLSHIPRKSLLSFDMPIEFSVTDPRGICSDAQKAERLRIWGLYYELESALWHSQ